MKILHVTTGLGQGGAEGVLFRLVAASEGDVEHVVVSLTDDLYYGPRLKALGVDVVTMGMRARLGDLYRVVRLRKIIANARPDVVQTWMYHADLIGGLVGRWAGVRAIVWGVRNALVETGKASTSARLAAWACAGLSSWLPQAIACCSERAAGAHQDMGYCAGKFAVIPNGYDLENLKRNVEAGMEVRAEWNVEPGTVVLGMVARWDPYKDHGNLLHALALLKDRGVNFKCALVGKDMVAENAALTETIAQLSLGEQTVLAGPRDDIPAVMSALDVHVLASAAEAFPNTVAEAMACGTPCVSTDVGDAPLIVGETGWIVPPRDARALADAIESALDALSTKDRAELARQCRTRVEDHFGIERMVSSYLALWNRAAISAAPTK